VSGPSPKQARARTTVCGAKQGFRNPKANSPGPCVQCSCGNAPPECTLYPYSSDCCKPPRKTGHHVIPKHCFYQGSVKEGKSVLPEPPTGSPCRKYNPDRAPCICVQGKDKSEAEHRDIHLKLDAVEHSHSGKGAWTYEEARDAGLAGLSAVDDLDECKECVKAQLDDYHKETCCVKDSTPLKASPYPAADAAAAGAVGAGSAP
jgi:hypothetical protein